MYSIVIPCYKSAATIEKVILSTVEEFGKTGIDKYEFVLVNDCSPDERKTTNVLLRMAEKYPFVKVEDLGKMLGKTTR